MIEVKIEMNVLGKSCFYEPQPDITAYEAALLHKLLVVATQGILKPEDRDAYITMHSLQRHWVAVAVDAEEPKVPAGYTAEELERDNPYNAWMNER